MIVQRMCFAEILAVRPVGRSKEEARQNVPVLQPFQKGECQIDQTRSTSGISVLHFLRARSRNITQVDSHFAYPFQRLLPKMSAILDICLCNALGQQLSESEILLEPINFAGLSMAVNFHLLESKCLVTLSSCYGSRQLQCIYNIYPINEPDNMHKEGSIIY